MEKYIKLKLMKILKLRIFKRNYPLFKTFEFTYK
jgi:hypothetical protein